ncbi:MAG: response regulator [Pseudomonadota bacterium]|nr:response regulator [Pseudomonadota bacterium]
MRSSCEVVARVLAANEYDVHTACGGESAVAELARRPYDAVLTDIMMPGMSGWELLRRATLYPGTVFLLMSGGCPNPGLVAPWQFLAKPFTTEELLRFLDAGLRRPQGRSDPGTPAVTVHADSSAATVPAMSDKPSEALLASLLESLFDADALHRFLRQRCGPAFVDALPGPTAPLTERCVEAVGRLSGAKLVNELFFAALREARPDRAADIMAVEDQLRVRAAILGVSPTRPRRPAAEGAQTGAGARYRPGAQASTPAGLSVQLRWDPLYRGPEGPARDRLAFEIAAKAVSHRILFRAPDPYVEVTIGTQVAFVDWSPPWITVRRVVPITVSERGGRWLGMFRDYTRVYRLPYRREMEPGGDEERLERGLAQARRLLSSLAEDLADYARRYELTPGAAALVAFVADSVRRSEEDAEHLPPGALVARVEEVLCGVHAALDALGGGAWPPAAPPSA